MKRQPSYPEQVLALLNPPIIIPIDERDDILHTPEWPQCKDESCPCHEDAPYQSCPCSRCAHVRQVLGEWQDWHESILADIEQSS